MILYYIYPKRMSRDDLLAALARHPFKTINSMAALRRIAPYIDDDGRGRVRLRSSGLRKIEELFADAAG